MAGVYVGPELRGHSVGRQITTALVTLARTLPDVERLLLTVAADNAAAQALYRKVGFQLWGTECVALKVGDTDVDEDHLVLVL